MRSGAKALVEALEKSGVEVVFGYPGGNVIDIFDVLGESKTIRFVQGRHEQGSVHMADGYARALGRPGVVLVTSGPGLTNTITGLGCANMDGVPMVLVCGQVALDQIGTDAFQEADTTGLTRAVSKHNFLVHSADEIPETVAEAFYIATHGKPGPVVIDIPLDCQKSPTAAAYPERVVLRSYHPEAVATTSEINRLAKAINSAARPVILAGGGVIAAEAAGEVARLARKASIPVATTMMGIGTIDVCDPLALGMAGVHGSLAANAAIAKADLVLALGVRFNDRVTGNVSAFARRAKIIHVDLDPSSIGKNVEVDLGIVADIKDLLTTVDSRVKPARRDAWRKAVAALRPRRETRASAGGRRILPGAVMEAINRLTGGEALVAVDVGQHLLWAAKSLGHSHPRRFLASGGMGAMGFGIPAAIGAAIARPELKTIALVGDGGAQMTFEELMVAAERKTAVTFVVFVNGSLGLVRQMQRERRDGRFFATALKSPDFVKLASAYGVRGYRVERADELERTLKLALKQKAPTLVEVQVGEADA